MTVHLLADLARRSEAVTSAPTAEIVAPLPLDETPRSDGLYPYQAAVKVVLAQIYGSAPANLLIASPTGSGKTFGGEEAARQARAAGLRLLVGEPLVALACQIFERLGGRKAEGLALQTGMRSYGDPSTAAVRVATYEVLARVLSSPDALDGCPLVVLDEFHSVAGDRGPVLLEILAACRAAGACVAALSGTLPNREDVAALLCRCNGLPTLTGGAARRPVDLVFEHYDSAARRLELLPGAPDSSTPDLRCVGGVESRQDLLALLRALRAADRCSALIVAFSCARLDQWAAAAADVDWGLDRAQRSAVALAFDKLLASVPAEDGLLFQELRRWAERGVATHHSHRPVQYLELVCRLAEQRCLPFVFSSSTLSAGINLPVRTVVLTSARLPESRAADGGLRDLDAALFHQLAGRAGRPGLETTGYVVVAGRGAQGRRAAQHLRDRAPGAVVPRDEVTAGDVLRARRQRRSVAADRLVFGGGLLRGLARAAQESEALYAEALELLPSCERATARRRGDVLTRVLAAPDALLRLARPKADKDLWLAPRGPRAGFAVVSAPPGLPLTARKPATRFPAEDFGAIIELRAQLRELATLDVDEAGRHLAALAANAWNDGAVLRAAPGHEEEEVVARELERAGYLDAGVLTDRGAAACELRTFASRWTS